MRRVLVTGSRAWTDTSTIRGVFAAVWGGGTALLASAACPASADEIAETIWTLTPDLHGGLCAGHPYPSPWDSELDGVLESAAQRARRHREAQAICRRCPIMAADPLADGQGPTEPCPHCAKTQEDGGNGWSPDSRNTRRKGQR